VRKAFHGYMDWIAAERWDLNPPTPIRATWGYGSHPRIRMAWVDARIDVSLVLN